MRLERLRVVNFRRLKHVDIELPDGVIGLVGRNGAGKSTLLECIGWCFYGHDAARTGKDLIKRRGALPGDDVSVTVAFRFGGNSYEVTRELLGKGGSHVASVVVDNTVVVSGGAQSQRETTEFLTRLFHMDREAFFTSLVARQRELSALSDAKPNERKRVLLSLLRIDAVDDAIQAARLERRDARKELEGLRAAFVDLAPLRERLGVASKRLEQGAEESLMLETRIRDLEEALETRRSARDESRRRADEHRGIAAELRGARLRVEDATRALGLRSHELAGVQRARSEAAALMPRLEALPAARERLDHLTAMRLRHEERTRIEAELAQCERVRLEAVAEAEQAGLALEGAPALRERAAHIPQERAGHEARAAEAAARREQLMRVQQRHDEAVRVRLLVQQAEAEAKSSLAEAEEARAAMGPLNAVRRLAARLPEERARYEQEAARAQLLAVQRDAAAEQSRRLMRELEETSRRIQELGPESPCPTCTRPLGEHYDPLLSGFEKDLQRHAHAIDETLPALAEAREHEAQARAMLAELAARETELRAKLETLAREETRIAAAQSRAQAAMARADEAARQAAALEAEAFDAEALAQAQAQELTAREALRALAAEEAALRQRLERLAREEMRLESARARAAECEQRAARLGDQARALLGEPFEPRLLDEAARALAELEALRETHTRLMAVADREAELTTLVAAAKEQEAQARAALTALEARVAALAFDVEAHAAVEKACEDAEARLNEARLARERLHGDLARAQDEAQRLRADIAQQETLREREGGLEARVRLLEQLAGERQGGLLPDFKDHLIGRIRPLLSTHAGRLFRDLTDGRYADLELGDDYDLLVHEEGQAFALSRFSGGEGDLANLCLRLAVSQVVAERAGTEGFGFLALDEIFGSQDEVRKGNILRALSGLTGRFRQILLITHIEDVKEAAEHVLRVTALEDGTSEVVLES